MASVTCNDVVEALPRVRAELNPTALLEWPGLSELFGCRVFLKHENHQPTGAFKVRGGLNLMVDSMWPLPTESTTSFALRIIELCSSWAREAAESPRNRIQKTRSAGKRR